MLRSWPGLESGLNSASVTALIRKAALFLPESGRPADPAPTFALPVPAISISAAACRAVRNECRDGDRAAQECPANNPRVKGSERYAIRSRFVIPITT